MKLIKLTCNNCGAHLDVDIDKLQAFCPYCGQKLLLDFDQLGQILAEKERTRRELAREMEQTKRKQMEYEYKLEELERKYKAKDRKKKWETIGAVAILLFSLGFMLLLPHMIFGSEEKEHNEKVAYLQQLEVEIDQALEEGDYDAALLKANKMYCDDNWSTEETRIWNVKRLSYLEIINEKIKDREVNDPNNIFMPTSSEALEGENYEDVIDQLETLGFTNVTSQVASKPAGLLRKANTVEHVLIGGVTKFSAKDYFDKDTKIIVYYYAKKD